MKSHIQDILDSGQAPGITTDTPKVDHASVYHKAPLGLAAVENTPKFKHGPTRSAKDISRYFGMPTDFIRKTWSKAPVVLLLLCFCLTSKAGPLTSGVSFVNGQTVSAAQLMNLVNLATVNNSFISAQAINPAALSTDTLLIFSPTLNGLYKMTLATAFLSNSNLITAQGEKITPVSGDYLLLWDSVSGTLQKVSAGNLVLGNTNLINGQPFVWASNILSSITVPVLNGPTNGQTTVSNLFQVFGFSKALTNLLSHTAPTNADGLMVWDSLHGTNKLLTFTNLFNTVPSVTVPTNGDKLLIWSAGTNSLNPGGTNPYFASIPIQDIGPRTLLVDNLPCTNQTVLNTNVIFPQRPWVRAALVVTNAGVVGLGYVNGDEIPLDRAFNSAAVQIPAYTYGAGFTNVFLNGLFSFVGGLNIPQKSGAASNSALFNSSPTNFTIRVYVTYFPLSP